MNRNHRNAIIDYARDCANELIDQARYDLRDFNQSLIDNELIARNINYDAIIEYCESFDIEYFDDFIEIAIRACICAKLHCDASMIEY